MNRRQFFAGVTVSVASLTGCIGNITDSTGTETQTDTDEMDPTEEQTETPAGTQTDTSPEKAPVEVLEEHWEAYRNERREEYIATFHSDSPMLEGELYYPDEEETFTIKSREIIEETDTVVKFEEIFTVATPNDTRTRGGRAELRIENGAWKVWVYREFDPEA